MSCEAPAHASKCRLAKARPDPRLQIALEPDGPFLVRKFDDDVEFPGTITRGAGKAARVVRRKAFTNVRRQPNVEVWSEVGTPEDVDESLGSWPVAD